jgi:penicillin-binding protein 1A
MSPLDMASGAQTLANGGVHMEPYFIERIEDPQGIVYQHENPGTVVFTPDVAHRITSILEGVMTSGTARRSALAGRESAGKTGTQDNNTNAWFVGYTAELTTAVWVGHQDLYLPMNNIPEFVAAGVRRVQGGTFPAAIWKATMDAALFGVPPSRFPAPSSNLREPFQVFLPGVDCLAYATPQSSLDSLLDRFSTTSTTQADDLETPETTAFTVPVNPGSGYGTVANPPPDVARITTTVPRGMIDPIWPVPTVDPNEYAVVPCQPVP